MTGNIPVRLVFGTADAQDASFFTGRGKSGAEQLGRYKGDALLITDGGTTRLAVGDEDLARLPQDAAQIRPWQESGRAGGRTTEPQTVPVQGGHSGVKTAPNRPVLPVPAGSNGSSGSLPSAPFLDRAPRSADEVARIQAIYAATGSKSATCRTVWGYKNGEVWGWLEAAISGRHSAFSG